MLAVITSVFVMPETHEVFIEITNNHPYIMGFVKFSVLSTMGELLAIRIGSGEWKKPSGVIYRFIVWGFIGMLVVLMFNLFGAGVKGAMAKGLIISFDGGISGFWDAFMIASIMNLVFAPVFMTVHRFTDTYIDLVAGEKVPASQISLSRLIATIDWDNLIGFVVVKTIPFFWIPAHTIVFMLPGEYRVLVAAYLSIALGIILSYSKILKSDKNKKMA